MHPEDQIDPFVMYCKASMLMSRVKNFNLRYRGLKYIEDPSVMHPQTSTGGTAHPLSIRTTPAFIELHQATQNMKAAMTKYMKDPMKDGKFDAYVFNTWNIVHL